MKKVESVDATPIYNSCVTPFTEKAKALIKRIPRGRVATYGQIACLAGFPGAARQVAWLLHSSSDKDRLPWHRVIGGRGRISLPRVRGFETQLRLLRAEGVEVSPSGRVDLGRFLWEPRIRTLE
jgi:methylated-DNA-protein-cysteine methyltransferase-like protein